MSILDFGYCLLGRVIEQVTGQSYETYVQANILARCGITDMQIANNSERHRASNEVVYIGQYSEDPYKINIIRVDSADGWIASSTQLVQLLNHVAGAPNIPALLKPDTIRTMTTPSPAYPHGDARYARAWMVSNNGAGSWWHSGSLPGSPSLMVHNPDGSCLAALLQHANAALPGNGHRSLRHDVRLGTKRPCLRLGSEGPYRGYPRFRQRPDSRACPYSSQLAA